MLRAERRRSGHCCLCRAAHDLFCDQHTKKCVCEVYGFPGQACGIRTRMPRRKLPRNCLSRSTKRTTWSRPHVYSDSSRQVCETRTPRLQRGTLTKWTLLSPQRRTPSVAQSTQSARSSTSTWSRRCGVILNMSQKIETGNPKPRHQRREGTSLARSSTLTWSRKLCKRSEFAGWMKFCHHPLLHCFCTEPPVPPSSQSPIAANWKELSHAFRHLCVSALLQAGVVVPEDGEQHHGALRYTPPGI